MQMRLLLLGGLVLVSMAFWWHSPEPGSSTTQVDSFGGEVAQTQLTRDVVATTTQGDVMTVQLGDSIIQVTVADDLEERIRGLSGTESLATGTGKWFVFDESGSHGIWMKDMQYPIDVLWFDEAYQVVHIVERFTPESYVQRIVEESPVPAQYVLEVNAGVVAEEEWRVGDSLVIIENLQ